MKMVHAGDLHVWRTGIPFTDLFSLKRWLGSGNLLLNRAAKFPPSLREPALKAIENEKPDVVVFSGDFSQSSQAAEFRECARLFAALRESLGDRLFAIPGNHDVYTPASLRKRLLEQELPWVHLDPVTRMDLGDQFSLVGVNHSEAFRIRSNGRVRSDTQEQLRATLEACRKDQRVVILIGHYPYATPPEYPETPQHKLLGEEKFAALVREFAPPLYLHGHKHVRWALRPSVTPDTLCLNCGSLGMRSVEVNKQAGFLSWDLQEDGSIRHLTAHHLTQQGDWRKTPTILSIPDGHC